MKTTRWRTGGAALAVLLATNLSSGQEPSEPTKAQKSDDLAAKLEQMRDDYRELQSECWGKGYYLYETGGEVWYLTEPPNPESCKKAEALKDDYRAAFKELLKLDRRRVLFDDIPKYVDRR